MSSDKPFSTTKRILAILAGTGLILCLAAGGYLYWKLHYSLPVIDGQARLAGLTTEAKVERDSFGVPKISAANEADAYRALGYCHAQDRFFQMDLMRRSSAGELSELVGKATLGMDQAVLTHGFRRLATENYARLPAEQRALAEAYTQGVNAGLASLATPPWEYAVLRSQPRKWEPVDSMLVGYTMVQQLQDEGYYERCLTVLRDTLGEPALKFFAPAIGPDDAAVDGSRAELPPMPSPAALNLRPKPKPENPDLQIMDARPSRWGGTWVEGAGSNAFAVAGTYTKTGAAMVANDMHLALGVPNIWYRIGLSWPSGKAGETITFNGLTLAGVPLPITGSNGHVAWGFTASYADTADLVPIEHDPLAPQYYRTPEGDKKLEERSQLIQVRGEDPVPFTQTWSCWGPIVASDSTGHKLALEWTAHKPGAVDFAFTAITRARNTAQAADIAHHSGLPALNMIVGDKEGVIAWTLAGRLPARRGYSGRLPAVHSFADRGWDGLLPGDKNPILYPKNGYFSSSNERLFGEERLAVLGDGGYEAPHRGRQVQADMAAAVVRGALVPRDLLAVQLDERALYLSRYRDLLVETLSKPGAASTEQRQQLLKVAKEWDGRATAHSAGQLIARVFRQRTESRILWPIMQPCIDAYPAFRWTRFNYGPAVWTLLKERPLHLLDPGYKDWDTLLLAAADDTAKACSPLGEKNWSALNTAQIRHPLLLSLPRWASSWADMPDDALAGDSDLPRVVRPAFGASERFGVSPGHEDEAYLHMPGGQSAHPLSPFFAAGHQAWVRGEPQPFLPGPARHTLVLKP